MLQLKKYLMKLLINFKNINGFVKEMKLSSEEPLITLEISQILLKFKLLNYLISQKNYIFYISLYVIIYVFQYILNQHLLFFYQYYF